MTESLCAMKVIISLSLGEQFKLETPSGDELPTKVLNIASHVVQLLADSA